VSVLPQHFHEIVQNLCLVVDRTLRKKVNKQWTFHIFLMYSTILSHFIDQLSMHVL